MQQIKSTQSIQRERERGELEKNRSDMTEGTNNGKNKAALNWQINEINIWKKQKIKHSTNGWRAIEQNILRKVSHPFPRLICHYAVRFFPNQFVLVFWLERKTNKNEPNSNGCLPLLNIYRSIKSRAYSLSIFASAHSASFKFDAVPFYSVRYSHFHRFELEISVSQTLHCIVVY